MIRIAALKLVDRPGERSRIEGKLGPGVRVEVRRDDVDRSVWHLLSTHPLVPAPPNQVPSAEQSAFRRPGEKARAAAAAKDLLEALRDRPLDDDISDIGRGT